jgi:TPR repeat protein
VGDFPSAMHNLGRLYEEGLGIPVNIAKTMQLYVDVCYLKNEDTFIDYRRLKFK